MSQMNSQYRGLTIISLKIGTCVTTFLDEKNSFFQFEGPLKTFFWPPKPYLALEIPTLGGGEFFNLSYGFRDSQGWFCPKMAIFDISNS